MDVKFNITNIINSNINENDLKNIINEKIYKIINVHEMSVEIAK